MRLWILFDAGKNPVPVIVNEGEDRPSPEDLICRFRGNQSLVDERVRWAQTGNPPQHDYQWLGPYNVPTGDAAMILPRVFEDQRYEDEEYSLADGPWGRSDRHVNEYNPDGAFFYIPGYDEVPICDIPTAEQCQNVSDGVGYAVNAHLEG